MRTQTKLAGDASTKAQLLRSGTRNHWNGEILPAINLDSNRAQLLAN
jgi:hypothetical protein